MSLATKLEELINPNPTYADPQDLDFDAVKPVVVNYEDELDVSANAGPSSLQRINTLDLAATDERYHGATTSRKNLSKFNSDSETDNENDESENLAEDESENLAEDESENLAEDESENLAEDESENLDEDLESDEDAETSSEAEADENETGSEIDDEAAEHDEVCDEDEEMTTKSEQTFQIFSNLNLEENAEKGCAIKCQLQLWDSLLECRIKLQKVLSSANMLPQYDSWPDFWKCSSDSAKKIKDSQKSVTNLLDTLIKLQSSLAVSATRNVSKSGNSNSENDSLSDSDNHRGIEAITTSKSLKRKGKIQEYSQNLKKMHLDYQTFRDAAIQKWDDKTKVSAGRLKNSFAGFEQSALQQIQQILNDEDRLVKRTQLKRTIYQVLGKRQDAQNDENQVSYHESVLKQDSHLNDYDKEVFDDNDFYHQLLRELIEHKTSDISDSKALSRQWLEIQKLRSKIKKKVDTRASKGRKLRFDVHPKLAGYMAPKETCAITGECRKELFGSLFGKLSTSNYQISSDEVKIFTF